MGWRSNCLTKLPLNLKEGFIPNLKFVKLKQQIIPGCHDHYNDQKTGSETYHKVHQDWSTMRRVRVLQELQQSYKHWLHNEYGARQEERDTAWTSIWGKVWANKWRR